MATKKKTTKAPTGLSVKRSKTAFTVSWKCSDKNYNDGQTLQYRLAGDKWKSIKISAKVRTATLTLKASSLFPSKAKTTAKVEFRVRGKRETYTKGKTTYKYKASKWAAKSFEIKKPKAPASVTDTLDDTGANKCKFEWATTTSDTDAYPFVDTVWESVLLEDVTDADLSKADWTDASFATGKDDASGSVTFTEDSSVIEGRSFTRCVRAKSRGMGGASGWTYGKHVYAMPYAPVVTGVESSVGDSSRHTRVAWAVQRAENHPIDAMECQYLVDTPEAGLTCPTGASWTTAKTIIQTDDTMASEFNSDTEISTDKCMWVRVLAKHDDNTAYSEPVFTTAGALAAPTLSTGTAQTTSSISVEATNNSSIDDSYMVVYLRLASEPDKAVAVAVIPHGETAVTAPCMDLSGESGYQIGVQAVAGNYTTQAAGAYTTYSVVAKMQSGVVWQGNEAVATPPANVKAVATNSTTVRLSWDWSWAKANQAVISWADHEDAWESTDEPSDYDIESKATSWLVGGLDEGSTYWFRILLRYVSADDDVKSAWSDAVSINLATTPTAPTLAVSESTLGMEDTITFTAGYSGEGSFYVEIAEMVDGKVLERDGKPVTIAEATATKQLSTTGEAVNKLYEATDLANRWAEGETHYVAARISSGTETTAWSDAVAVTLAPKPTVTKATTSLVETIITETDTEGAQQSRTVNVLKEMPLAISVTGSAYSYARAVITRVEDYTVTRPDEKKEQSYAGEVIYSGTSEDGNFTVELGNLSGHLDDDGEYTLIISLVDAYGQTVSRELPFEIHWTHQPSVPIVTVATDSANMATTITTTAPADMEEGDTIDIYRMSADSPELIVKDGEYGTTYVDPYPAFGEQGGHRVVAKTASGDYITADSELAWADTDQDDGDMLTGKSVVIDFGGERVELPYNLSLSNSWEKDFEQTTYLGGSVAGDWNPAVTRSLSVDSVGLTFDPSHSTENMTRAELMRRLAIYPGICHVRTPDGSSFPADVQVEEERSTDSPRLIAFSLSISRVDAEEFDGMTLEEWEALNG